MTERRLLGTPASPGVGLGAAWHPGDPQTEGAVRPEARDEERDTGLAALAAAAQSLAALADGLSPSEAAIIEAGALMAQDPVLLRAVEEAIVAEGLTAPAAIIRATGRHADAIAALGDETLAARADDVRSLGRRAARLASGRQESPAPPSEDLIVIAGDLGPADVAELAPALAGIALAGGGATAHAAIVARSLDIPMVTGLGDSVLEVAAGARVIVDGTRGELALEPSAERAADARNDTRARRLAAQRARELRHEPAVTTDGVCVTVLANVASPEELDVALAAGAEGIGLLRTELAFLDAEAWPDERQHSHALDLILRGIEHRGAVVRVLDFGADKSPPFLRDTPQRGLELLLGHKDALRRQIGAILLAAERCDVRILLPMVDTPSQLAEVRVLVEEVAQARGIQRIPPLGAMIETPAAVENAGAIAEQSGFLSIGTNDLTATVLGVGRFAANTAAAHHPKVLRAIRRSVEAAHEAGITIEVCGEAASDPLMLPLLIGLGVDELSVGAARVGQVRDWIRRLDSREAAGLARSALTMDGAEEVEWALRSHAAALQTSTARPAIHAVGS